MEQGFVGKTMRFLGQRKKYWLLPLVVVVVVFGLLLIVAQKSGTGPFHYTF